VRIDLDRGLDAETAEQVARQLAAKDQLGTHMLDELGISEIVSARPVQAAVTSAATFSVGAALPLLATFLTPMSMIMITVSAASLIFLAMLGAVGARSGGATMLPATIRVTFWGAAAMALTALIERLAGTVL